MTFDRDGWVTLLVCIGQAFVPVLVNQLLVKEEQLSAWYTSLKKPKLITPPPIAFAIVWSILYLLLAVSGFLVLWLGDPNTTAMQVGFAFHSLQLLLNAAWSPLFFGAHRLWAAFIVLVALLVLSTVAMVTCALATPWSLVGYVPYVSWLVFAAFLNAGFAIANPVEDESHKMLNNTLSESSL